MANGESLFSYKARTSKTPTPTPKPRRSNAAVNTQNKDKAKGPKPLTKAEQFLKDNPPNRQGIVDEVKSMLNPRNLTGANAITAAIKGEGMSKTKRVTTALSGVVQGLGFAAGVGAGKTSQSLKVAPAKKIDKAFMKDLVKRDPAEALKVAESNYKFAEKLRKDVIKTGMDPDRFAGLSRQEVIKLTGQDIKKWGPWIEKANKQIKKSPPVTKK